MHKILSFYNSNRRVIWTVILAIILIIVLLQTLNNNAKKKNSKINKNEINSSSDTTIYPNNEDTSLNNNYNNEKVKDEKLKIISSFLDKCNNGKMEEAYSLLSIDCKNELFPNIEKFKNEYINLIFNETKTYDIKLWMLGEYNIYKIGIYENALSKGFINSQEKIDSYYTVVEENNDYKININNFVAKEEINTKNSNDYVEVNVISKKIYIDYEEYEIKITNKTLKTILMDGYRKNNTVYLQDSLERKRTANLNEIPQSLLVINPLLSVTRTIKFSKSYTEKISSKGITFEDIILDYNEYSKKENKQDYNNISSVNVGI